MYYVHGTGVFRQITALVMPCLFLLRLETEINDEDENKLLDNVGGSSFYKQKLIKCQSCV